MCSVGSAAGLAGRGQGYVHSVSVWASTESTHINAPSGPLPCGRSAGHGYDGAAMITASHLPVNRNGVKFCTAEVLLMRAVLLAAVWFRCRCCWQWPPEVLLLLAAVWCCLLRRCCYWYLWQRRGPVRCRAETQRSFAGPVLLLLLR